MPDVFISYSRKDSEFTRRLHASLAGEGRDVWVDWEDIPKSADWWNEIQTGIEASDSFVFIISPDSVRSDVCRDEIESAIANHKRIIPLLHREVVDEEDKAKIHPSISAHNWVFFRDHDDYDYAYQSLASALDTDLEYVRMHTRLLVRAHEWEEGNRERSRLLDGQEILNAEAWLSSGANKSPAPTQLHAEYIFASRRVESRRQRVLLSGVSVALIVVLILMVISVLLFRQSEDNLRIAEQARREAEHQGQISRSIGLAAQVEIELESSASERGLLVALEALENYPYTWQAERALGIAIQNSPLRLVLEGHTGRIYSVSWSPDSQRLATASEDATLRLWDVAAGEQVFQLDGLMRNIAWSPSGDRLLGSNGDVAKIWDGETFEELHVFEGLIVSAVWSSSGEQIATNSLQGDVNIWDSRSGDLIMNIPDQKVVEIGVTTDVAWSSNNRLLVTVDTKAVPRVWDVGTQTYLFGLNGHAGAVNSVAFAGDNQRILTAGADGMVKVWNASNGEETLSIDTLSGPVRTAQWSSNGSRIVSFNVDGRVSVWDAETGDEIFISEALSSSVALSPDGDYIVTTYDEDFVSIWEVEIGGELLTFIGDTANVTQAQWSPDGVFIVTTSADGTLKIWDASPNGEVSTFIQHQDRVETVHWSPDGQWIVTGGLDETARVWDARTAEERFIFDDHAGLVEDVAWSPDGRFILTGSWDSTAIVWDAATGEALAVIKGHDDILTSVDWSSDSQRVLTASADGTAKVWDASGIAEDGTADGLPLLFTLEAHTDGIIWAAWSPDGALIATASRDGTARIWGGENGAPVQTLGMRGSGSRLYSAAWSPDSQWLATGSRDGEVMVWHAREGTAVSVIGHSGLISSVSWSPTGDRLATSSFDETVQIWELENLESVERLIPSHVLRGHIGRVYSAMWTANGQRLVTVDSSGRFRVWEMQTGREIGRELRTVQGHRDEIYTALLSPNGEQFVTISQDGRAKVWWTWESTQDMIDHARACCAVRELSDEERDQFNLPVTQAAMVAEMGG